MSTTKIKTCKKLLRESHVRNHTEKKTIKSQTKSKQINCKEHGTNRNKRKSEHLQTTAKSMESAVCKHRSCACENKCVAVNRLVAKWKVSVLAGLMPTPPLAFGVGSRQLSIDMSACLPATVLLCYLYVFLYKNFENYSRSNILGK